MRALLTARPNHNRYRVCGDCGGLVATPDAPVKMGFGPAVRLSLGFAARPGQMRTIERPQRRHFASKLLGRWLGKRKFGRDNACENIMLGGPRPEALRGLAVGNLPGRIASQNG